MNKIKPQRFREWRWRWVYMPHGKVLHRILKAGREKEDYIPVYREGVTVCGEKGVLQMPGIFSRMGRKRCQKCCDILGIPHGDGAPFNVAKKGETWKNS